MAEKIRILFLAANPVDAGYHPRLDEEAREIDEKIQAGTERDAFEVLAKWAVRPSDLQKALLRHKPHIVHFSGHGSKNKGITLEDREGNMTPVSKAALIGLFGILKDNIKIVFLNACHSRRQIDALRDVIDFTIAMNAAIGDAAAVIFASYFYQGLAFGRSVREAFELAKIQLELEGIHESKKPELLEKEGADAAKAYLVRKAPATGSPRSKTKNAGAAPESKIVAALGKGSLAAESMSGTIIIGDQNKVRTGKGRK